MAGLHVPVALHGLDVSTLARPLHRLRWAQRAAALRWHARHAVAPAGPASGALVVISPHLDDAALSCAGLVAGRPGARVVTAFTAGPTVWDRLTEWDRSCGFRAGDDVMAIRKREDVAALALLGATPVWLGLVEGQYEPRPGVEEVTDCLRQALTALTPEPAEIAIPLGVDHGDHVTVSDAMLSLRDAGLLPGATWLVYGDLPYAERSPELAEARRAELAARGVRLEPHERPPQVDPGLKCAAVGRYRTQIRPLWRSLPVRMEERLWRLP